MKFLIILAITYLTFMLTLNYNVFKLIERYNKKISDTLKNYNFHIWCGIILLVGTMGWDTFYIAVPNQPILISELVIIMFALIPFMLTSGYEPQKNLKGITNFCIIHPIGEEILFRGIVLSLATYLVGSSVIYVPVPILKGVTLQTFISAICFGITHFQYFGFKINHESMKKILFAFIFGLFAGNLVESTGSIIYPVIFHVIANSGATLYYFKISNKNRVEKL
ncbi:CPBP family intramembrane glutamic endopeptidase [Alkaliphilus hydrothermalis]|uniref:Membrane protease YdiL (CAAX protease family) n=1 Tax=Alkaliphilus hydrothermalis TaxID=1482730 RepID=A0ABS2NMJ8_9FIRM|nr:CPBP family intramembrane glutamic endopeptidase [Alkaliphilus hydrothermalis]MBM7614127.1 membrane protease YdiL (CAAX protease family) [Alkaliphilus hydrothermalis]